MKLLISAFISTFVLLCTFTNLSASEDLTELQDIVQRIQKNNDALVKDVELFNKTLDKTMMAGPTCKEKCTIAEGACLLGCCYFGACNPVCAGACVGAYKVCTDGCDDFSSKENGKKEQIPRKQ